MNLVFIVSVPFAGRLGVMQDVLRQRLMHSSRRQLSCVRGLTSCCRTSELLRMM